jgi:hypothetical protein
MSPLPSAMVKVWVLTSGAPFVQEANTAAVATMAAT